MPSPLQKAARSALALLCTYILVSPPTARAAEIPFLTAEEAVAKMTIGECFEINTFAYLRSPKQMPKKLPPTKQ